MNITWNEREKNFIRENAGSMKDTLLVQELAKQTGRVASLQAVRKIRRGLGIIKCCGRGICRIATNKNSVNQKTEESPNRPITSEVLNLDLSTEELESIYVTGQKAMQELSDQDLSN